MSTVSAMANSLGGYIIYGILEKRDRNEQPMGLPIKVEGLIVDNWDKMKLKIEQLISDNIQPRIQGIEKREIKLAHNNKSLIILRVPQSIYAPHMVFLDKCSRFYYRTDGGNQIMDVNEIGNAFIKCANIYEKARNYRNERIKGVHESIFLRPIDLSGAAKMFMHVIPLFEQNKIDFTDKQIYDELYLHPLGRGGAEKRMNVDGILFYNSQNGCSYVQLFRDGKIEYCHNKPLSKKDNYINVRYFEDHIILCLEDVLKCCDKLKFSYPIIIFISLVGVKNYKLDTNDPFGDDCCKFERDELLLPEVILEKREIDCATILKPTFDVLWQAGGYQKCLNYDDEGLRKR